LVGVDPNNDTEKYGRGWLGKRLFFAANEEFTGAARVRKQKLARRARRRREQEVAGYHAASGAMTGYMVISDQ
jgi:hypothetical protein